jgi:hypothetical protein
MAFIRGMSSVGTLNKPFHAGITQDLIRHNIDWCIQKAVWHLDSMPISGAYTCYRDAKDNGDWTWFSTLGALMVPVRPLPSGYSRKYEVEVLVSHNLAVEQNAHLRAYLLPTCTWAPLGVGTAMTDATLPSTDAYCEMSIGAHESGDAGYESADIDCTYYEPVPLGSAHLAPTDMLWTSPGINVGWLTFIASTSATCVITVDHVSCREWVDTTP